MLSLKESILKILNTLFHRNNNNLSTPLPSQTMQIIKDVENSKIIDSYEKTIKNFIKDKEIPSDLELTSTISSETMCQLSKDFFNSLGKSFSEKAKRIMDSNSFPSKKVSLKELYEYIHQISSSFDLGNGNTDVRKIFGEITPQCIEKMLNNFLLDLDVSDMKKYGLDRSTLHVDIAKKELASFLSLKDAILSFNSNNKEANLRNILAYIYSDELMKVQRNDRMRKLEGLICGIEADNIESCSNLLRCDFKNSIMLQGLMSRALTSTERSYNDLLSQTKMHEILNKSKEGKNFEVTFANNKIYVNLESEIPFILAVPNKLSNGQTLVMESNNLETDNAQNLLEQALRTCKQLTENLTSQKHCPPVFIPILPGFPQETARNQKPYYQQLSADCFKDGKRPDLAIVDAIKQAKNIIRENNNVDLEGKIFLNGYSSSGVFAQRFSFIHPELIATACIGGASGSIPIPDINLDYPLGIRNYKELFGKDFDIEEYKKIGFNYYVGSLECETPSPRSPNVPMHDMSFFSRSVPENMGEDYRNTFGENMFDRAEKITHLLRNMGISIHHTVIPNVAHNEKEARLLQGKFSGAEGIAKYMRRQIKDTYKEVEQLKSVEKKER